MRFTLTVKLLAAFATLALVASLPGAGLLYGVTSLDRTTHENREGLEARDACNRARAAAIGLLTGLQSHALFPEDPRFVEAAGEDLAAAERLVNQARPGLSTAEAADLAGELAAVGNAAQPLLAEASGSAAAADSTADRQGEPRRRQAMQTAVLALIGHLDATAAEINQQLERRDAAVAATVDRLSRLGRLGLGATGGLALGLALTLGTAFRRRMGMLRAGVERVTGGDLSVRIDDRESDEIGALAHTFNRMAGELELLEEMKSQFVAVASHELRTPLTLIEGYCGILLSPAKGPISDWQRERIERIHGQVQELLRLVQDLLDAERLQERALAPVSEPFEPEALALGLHRDFDHEARARGLNLTLQVAPGTPQRGHADVRALTRVLRNLIDNAIKYTASGKVSVTLAGEAGWLTLAVNDTGCGIPADELPRIFQRFYQVQHPSRPRRGFGLGLSIVRGLIERNGGSIEASSIPGEGSTFRVRWPIAVGETAPGIDKHFRPPLGSKA